MIKIRDLRKSFDDNEVLKGVNLDVLKGETFTIIGGSGSGKSVLFKHIIGLMKPDYGNVIIDGKDMTELSEKELFKVVEKFGMVFQSGALFDSLTVGENILFGVKNKDKMSEKEKKELVEHYLNEVGLSEISYILPAELSGGMKKRVAIARAIAKQPEIIMFDEPTTGLDPIMADIINELIIKVSKRKNRTSIVITHDMVSAYKISDRIGMLYDGKIIFVGSPQDVKNTDNEIVSQFINGRSEGPIKIR